MLDNVLTELEGYKLDQPTMETWYTIFTNAYLNNVPDILGLKTKAKANNIFRLVEGLQGNYSINDEGFPCKIVYLDEQIFSRLKADQIIELHESDEKAFYISECEQAEERLRNRDFYLKREIDNYIKAANRYRTLILQKVKVEPLYQEGNIKIRYKNGYSQWGIETVRNGIIGIVESEIFKNIIANVDANKAVPFIIGIMETIFRLRG